MRSELVERAQRGDHEAFEELATDAYPRLYAVASRILRESDAADDAAQDTLVRAWRDLRSLRDRDRFDAWLHRLLVHACADLTRRSGRHRFDVAIGLIEPSDPADEITQVGDRDELERAFMTLPVDQRAALVLRHYVGLPPEAIADSLSVPVGTVNSRIHRARRAMRAALEDATSVPMALSEHGR